MKKLRNLTILLFVIILMFIIPNISKAAVEVTRERMASDMNYKFTGLTLDITHEYQFGFTKTITTEVSDWYIISEFTETTAIVKIGANNSKFANVITSVDTGYITIKDKTTDTVVLEPYGVDLTIPYLDITNYKVINNGKEFNTTDNTINIEFWNAGNSTPYYQYEKITDEKVINKYKEIKNKNGNYNELQSLLKTSVPTSGWNKWRYWNGNPGTGTGAGYGYPTSSINVPDDGLYYMWIYVTGSHVKSLYGYILVDNLAPEIALDSISLPKTQEVELGKTLKLTPIFSPINTTNKIVTWTSSDETVATVDNAGNITPKKIGSTIITVTSQDGKKKATCTVTVVAKNSGNDTNNNGNTTNSGNSNNTVNNSNNGGTNQGASNNNANKPKEDPTTATGTLPKTGLGMGLTTLIIFILGVGIFTFSKYKWYKDIK